MNLRLRACDCGRNEPTVPQTGADGGTAWTLDGATVTVLGSACDAILKGNVIDVRVVVGCPTVLR